MSLINNARLATRTLLLKLRKINSSTVGDYNAASSTYDEYYSRYLGSGASTLLSRLPVRPGMTIIDLACGTGFFTHYIAEAVSPTGRVFAVDLSPGMLTRNREKAAERGLANIEFVEGDATAWLESLPESSVDGLICGWGICYMDHVKLRAHAERLLRPGGFLGLIENRANTLSAVSSIFEKVLSRYPQALIKNMDIHLPKDHQYLVKAFAKGQIECVESWDGDICVPCATGLEVAEYMLRSGASAGFIDALDPTMTDTVMTEFVNRVDLEFREKGGFPVKHEYCALLGRHRAVPHVATDATAQQVAA